MPAKRTPQDTGQMLEVEQERRGNSKLYKAESALFVDGQITDLVTQTADELEAAGNMEPISLTDTDRVRAISMQYVRSCAEASTLPSISGLARALGLTRRAVYDCLDRGSPKDAARWFTLCRDAFSEMLETGSLRNSTNTITSIFLLKACYGYKEQPSEVVISQGSKSPYDGMTSDEAAAAIMQKYQDMVDD